jgi:hypothetical protein
MPRRRPWWRRLRRCGNRCSRAKRDADVISKPPDRCPDGQVRGRTAGISTRRTPRSRRARRRAVVIPLAANYLLNDRKHLGATSGTNDPRVDVARRTADLRGKAPTEIRSRFWNIPNARVRGAVPRRRPKTTFVPFAIFVSKNRTCSGEGWKCSHESRRSFERRNALRFSALRRSLVLEVDILVELDDGDFDADFGHEQDFVAGEGGEPPCLVRSFPRHDGEADAG